MRHMSFDRALDNGDYDAAVEYGVKELEDQCGRELTEDEVDRLERNVRAALKRRARKAPTVEGM